MPLLSSLLSWISSIIRVLLWMHSMSAWVDRILSDLWSSFKTWANISTNKGLTNLLFRLIYSWKGWTIPWFKLTWSMWSVFKTGPNCASKSGRVRSSILYIKDLFLMNLLKYCNECCKLIISESKYELLSCKNSAFKLFKTKRCCLHHDPVES